MKRFFVWFMSFFSFNQSNYPGKRKSTFGVERRRWSEEDDILLLKLFENNGSLLYMSLVLNRTEQAIRKRLYDLGYKYDTKQQEAEALRRGLKDDLQAQYQPIIFEDKLEPQVVAPVLPESGPKIHPSFHGNHLYLLPLVKPVSRPQEPVPIEPTKKPKNNYKPWTPEDDKAFVTLHSAGHRPIDMAIVLGRSEFAVLTRHNRLGLLPNR